ncbi:MAG TPA: glycosyl hydrolase 115 family protein [Pyrinomonadaceae bacterium]|nr:glycosyl hydrolase 115 family protein [Pyrinomonadaceae bacterium]
MSPWLKLSAVGLLFLLACVQTAAAQESSWVRGSGRAGDFGLVRGGSAADVYVSDGDFKVVRIAAKDLTADIERVTGVRPALRNETAGLSGHAVIVGTLGKSSLIDDLARGGKLDASGLRGQWETFLIATVKDPLPGVRLGLVVAGSDRRGTAYGVYELSQAAGVSPWYWWADVAPERRRELFVAAGARKAGPPSVKYRGIFINDEDWGLQPWAAKTFEPERGDIGPKTYARVFELLLRLKANTLWPAMHEVTRPFNTFPENRQVADDYAIVMGSSHAEPMLRNNVGEWKEDKKLYDYTKNAEGVRAYWEQRVRENGRFENLYTLGMRGIHDSPMQGPKTQAERIRTLEQIFADQRAMLARHVNPNVSEVPQIFNPYKEVLADYRAGLRVPEDVTVVYPDDNFGYIRTFPDEEERRRPGGTGVYYHISYLGRPLSYLWLNTTPPALVWEEMSKAYRNGARRFWMLNVGDIKPGEIGTEFFLQTAWDASRWRGDNLQDFLRQWAAREFGAEHAEEIASVMDGYYRLGFARKPEHLQWHVPGEPYRPSDFAHFDYGDEAQARMDAYDSLMGRATDVYPKLPRPLRDAYYQLVLYPVRCASFANRRVLAAEKAALYAAQGRASTSWWVKHATNADRLADSETYNYNERMLGGKWHHIMSREMGPGQWKGMRSTAPEIPPAVSNRRAPEAAGLGVAIEGRAEALREGERDAALPALDIYTRGSRFIDIFNTGRAPAAWVARAKEGWIKLSRTRGEIFVGPTVKQGLPFDVPGDARVLVSVDWSKAPKGEAVSGTVEIEGAGSKRTVKVPVFNPTAPRPESLKGFVESNGVVSIEAEHFTSKTDRAGAAWQVIEGLGRTGDSVAVFPEDAPSVGLARAAQAAPSLEYPLHLFRAGEMELTFYLIPTHPVRGTSGLRFAYSLDGAEPRELAASAGVEVTSRQWSENVLNATTKVSAPVRLDAGAHVLRIYMLDPGVVLDRVILNAGGLRPSYLGPPETRVVLK